MFYDGQLEHIKGKRRNLLKKKDIKYKKIKNFSFFSNIISKSLNTLKNNIEKKFDFSSFIIVIVLTFALFLILGFNYSFIYESIYTLNLNKELFIKETISSLYYGQNEKINFNNNNGDLNYIVHDEKKEKLFLKLKNIYADSIYTNDIYSIISSVGGDSNIVLEPVNFYSYKTQTGDTLWGIAKNYKISVDSIYSLNKDKLKDAHSLKIGMNLIIPSQTGLMVEVNSLDELDKKLNEYDVDLLSVLISNRASNKDELVSLKNIFFPNVELPPSEKLKVYGIDFGLPTYGYITSGFGFRIDPFLGIRRFHSGFDIANDEGTKVYAAYNGVVVFAGWDGGYGYKIIIKHPLGYETVYGHLLMIKVKVGQTVNKGQLIALMGSTGRSTGSHLHFEIRRFGRLLNPAFYIKGLPYKRRG